MTEDTESVKRQGCGMYITLQTQFCLLNRQWVYGTRAYRLKAEAEWAQGNSVH